MRGYVVGHGTGPATAIRLLGLLVRRLRLVLLAWFVPLWVLIPVILAGYRKVYPSLADRGMLVEQMRRTPATKLLYGELRLPGTLGQLLTWEVGTYVTVCIALMAVLITASVSRRDEELGLIELARSAGAGRWALFASGVVVVWSAISLFGAIAGLILTLLNASYDELSVGGAWAFCGTVVLVGWAFSAATLIGAQLARTGAGARGLGLGCLAVAFAARVVADQVGAGWLRWRTPMGWRDLIEPYSGNRFALMPIMTLACLLLLLAAAALHAGREYSAAYLPGRGDSDRRWRLRGYEDLLVRNGLSGWATWLVAVVAVSALFGTMSGAVTDLLQPGSPTAQWVGTASGGGDPVRQFLSLLTKFTVLMILVFAAARVGGLLADERAGSAEMMLATGQRRARLLAGRCAVAVAFSLLLLLAGGAALAGATTLQVTEHQAFSRAIVFTVSQFTGVLAVVGVCAALIGLAPRLIGLSWAVIAWSAFTQFFGRLVELPDWAVDLSVLGHQVDAAGQWAWRPHAVLLTVGLTGIVVGLVGYSRRDIPV